jgi:hypothetical protein
MAVTHKRHPEVKLDQAKVDLIQGRRLAAVDANVSGMTPAQFLHCKFAQGIFWINCANESCKFWLMWTISGLGELWEGAELTVDSEDLPKRPRVLVHVADTSEVTTVITCLPIQNPEINMADWSVMSCKVTEKEQMLAF